MCCPALSSCCNNVSGVGVGGKITDWNVFHCRQSFVLLTSDCFRGGCTRGLELLLIPASVRL